MIRDILMYDLAVFAVICILIYNVIKVAHRYAVQGSDTTMITIAASLPGQKTSIFFTA